MSKEKLKAAEGYYYAVAVTLSLKQDVSDEEIREFCRTIKKADYWCIVVENDKNGRKHCHAGQVFKHARTLSNIKRGTYKNSPFWREIMLENSHAIKIKKMHSDMWIAMYMQKDGLIYEHNLPSSFEEISEYFPDTNKSANKNAAYMWERWERMYVEEERPLPTNEMHVEEFFRHHWVITKDVNIIGNTAKRKETFRDMVMFLNKDVHVTKNLKPLTASEKKNMEFHDVMSYELAGTKPPKRPTV